MNKKELEQKVRELEQKVEGLTSLLLNVQEVLQQVIDEKESAPTTFGG